MKLFGSLRSQASVFRKVNDIVHFTELHCVGVWRVFQRGKSSVGRLALESGVWLLMGTRREGMSLNCNIVRSSNRLYIELNNIVHLTW